ncbi:hypothetical protein ABK040_005129 [Willaertia magna]
MKRFSSPLVSCLWLKENLGKPGIKVLDGSWHMPHTNRNGYQEYLKEHIPTAKFFDIDIISDTNIPLPHMLPDISLFEEKVTELGITNNDKIIVYDTAFMSACRVWYTFKLFGHDNCNILDGGLMKWKKMGFPVISQNEEEQEKKQQPLERYKVKEFRKEWLRDLNQILKNLELNSEYMIDARSAERFTGKQQEPRPGLYAGHIPGSKNLPFTKLINPETNEFKSPSEIKQLFIESGLPLLNNNEEDNSLLDKPIIASCGSGVSACNLIAALNYIGVDLSDIRLYDGSWSEYGKLENNFPIGKE